MTTYWLTSSDGAPSKQKTTDEKVSKAWMLCVFYCCCCFVCVFQSGCITLKNIARSNKLWF